MLIVRNSQITALTTRSRDKLLRALARHVTAFFPRETEGLDDQLLKGRLRVILKRAEQFGLVNERDLYHFTNISMLFGLDFNQRPEHSWMQAILKDPEVPNPGERMGRLYQEILARLDQAAANKVVEEAFFDDGK